MLLSLTALVRMYIYVHDRERYSFFGSQKAKREVGSAGTVRDLCATLFVYGLRRTQAKHGDSVV
jgi:hypothetical protein